MRGERPHRERQKGRITGRGKCLGLGGSLRKSVYGPGEIDERKIIPRNTAGAKLGRPKVTSAFLGKGGGRVWREGGAKARTKVVMQGPSHKCHSHFKDYGDKHKSHMKPMES